MRVTFDTGMLIALERRKQRANDVLHALTRNRIVPVVPAVAFVEWWRGPTDLRRDIVSMVEIEGMAPLLCRAAGEALGGVKGATLADAIVMASAALGGGGVVYTSDVGDLERLARWFPTVRVLPV